MDTNTLLIVMAALFAVTFVLILVIVLNNAKKTNDLNNELTRSIYEIRTGLNRDITDLSERLNSNIIQSHKASGEVFSSISEKMARISKAQDDLGEISKDILSLQDILTDKKSRGSFGEVEMYSLLEAAYGEEGKFYRKHYRLPNDTIADAAIFGAGSMGILCVDSKFPLENYRNMLDKRLDERSRELYRRKFRDDVKKHIDDIAKKYIIHGVTADLAYLFLPAEAIFSTIYSEFPDLTDHSYRRKVYIVSPTTLMAYITAIKSIYLGIRKNEKAAEIAALLNELAEEFARYEKRSGELYRNYEAMSSQFHDLRVTSDKIMKRFEKINAVEFEEKDPV